jgi:hypothetical protein
LANGGPFVGACGEMMVEAFHKGDGVDIVGASEASDSLFAKEFAGSGFARSAQSGRFPEQLRNRLGIAIAKRTYKAYRELLKSARWEQLVTAGAVTQRLLWALIPHLCSVKRLTHWVSGCQKHSLPND